MDGPVMRFFVRVIVALSVLIAPGCLPTQRSRLTPGMAKTHIVKGETSQAEVVEIFGPPNIITLKDGYEMWVYDKVSSSQTSAAFGLGAAGGGGSAGGLGGGGIGSRRRSETTVMLIIYFDENDTVFDYRMSQTKF